MNTEKYTYIRTCEDAQRHAPKLMTDEVSVNGGASWTRPTKANGIFHIFGGNVYRRLNSDYVDKDEQIQRLQQRVAECEAALRILPVSDLRWYHAYMTPLWEALSSMGFSRNSNRALQLLRFADAAEKLGL